MSTPDLVEATVSKETWETQTGIKFGLSENGSVIVSDIASNSIFWGTDLKIGQEIVSINGIPCDECSPGDCKEIIDEIEGELTIVTKKVELMDGEEIDEELAPKRPSKLPELGDDFRRQSQLVRRQSMVQKAYSLEFRHLEYKVKVKDPDNKKKQIDRTIIHDISGRVLPGRMLALMGSSGAGKSTLLDILAGRLSSKSWSGSITLNRKHVDPAKFRKLSGYVMQEDALLPLFTVRETLGFAARLRVGANLSNAKIDHLVHDTIDMLNLSTAADTIIGDELKRGISGGQKRRVSIGVDIIHQPAVVFLDEPTSGLDSSTALQVVSALRLMCETGRTVVVTVHQPSTRVFEAFDDVLFLNAGKCVYSGPTDGVVNYLEERSIDVPAYVNVPEFFLEKVGEYESEDRLEELTMKVEDQLMYSQETSITMNSDEEEGPVQPGKEKGSDAEFYYTNSAWAETKVLMERNASNLFRTKELFFARIALSILMAIVLGTLFLNASNPNEKAGFMVFGVAFFMFTSLEALPIFMIERSVFTRESSRGSYRTGSYAVAVSLVAIVFQILPATIFVCISYFMVGLEPGADNFFLYVLGQITVLVVGNAKATLISTLTNDPILGTTGGTALFAVFFLFSGFFIPREDIPGYWIWMHYLSTFNWCFESLAIAGFDKSQPDELFALERYGIENVSVWRGMGIIWCMTLVFRFMFYIVLKTKHRGVRH